MLLSHSDPSTIAANATKAIEILQAASPYELGFPGTTRFTPNLYPVYVRGQAYLAAHQPSKPQPNSKKSSTTPAW